MTRIKGPLLHPHQAADVLGVSTRTVQRWAESGRLKSIKTPGGHHRFYLSSLEEAKVPLSSRKRARPRWVIE